MRQNWEYGPAYVKLTVRQQDEARAAGFTGDTSEVERKLEADYPGGVDGFITTHPKYYAMVE